MKKIYFVICEERNEFELWVDGELITDCFSLDEESYDLMHDLVKFAEVPVYKKYNMFDKINY